MIRTTRYWLAVAIIVASWVLSPAELFAKPLPRVGLLSWTTCENSPLDMKEWMFLKQGLEELGYKPGQNIMIECRSAEENYARFASAASELARIRVDVIVATSEPALRAALQATLTIPIVSVQGELLGVSIAVPDLNWTGVVNYTIELTDKRLELLKEAIPTIRTVGVLSSPNGLYRAYDGHSRRAAEELKLELSFHRVKAPGELDAAYAAMKAQKVDAVIVSPDLMLASNAAQVSDLAIKHGLPIMAWDSRLTEAGFLMSYGSKSAELEKRLAFYVDRILAGTSAGRLPIEMASSFSLAINLRTASRMKISLPRSILIMADKVVE